ncbi:MAG: zinc-ribbon and DUF3426 domain-containing protein [Gammaproteobacteria bacterium]|nr:zinc-ribbon and DUF3426 domain-containing protein [Gammaproteobacteria bacterium]
MKIRCPGCDTRYQVDADALLGSQGRAHCYRCGTVFDAVTERVDETPPADQTRRKALTWLKQDDEADSERELPFDVPDDLPAIEPSDEAALDVTATLYEKRSWRGFFYGLFALLLAVGVALQLAWQYRLDILQRFPQLEIVCERLPCRPTLVHEPDAFRVLRRDMQVTPNDPGSLTLTATIRNEAEAAQALPEIQLSLLDNNGAAVVRRRLTPAEYLYPPPADDVVLKAGEVFTIAIDFNDPGALATGFAIDFF